MKKIILCIVLCIATVLSANKHDENYYKAAKLFNTGHYQEALDAYESLQPQSPITYYNTGIVLYHLKHYSKALAAWKKAQLYAKPSLFKKIEHNSNQAREKLGLAPDPGWYTTLLLLESYCSLFIFQILFLFLWLGWYFSFFIPIPALKKIRPFLLVLVVTFGSVVALKYIIIEREQGIVIVAEAKIFIGPNSEFHEVASVKEGEQVRVVRKDESWYKVQYRGVNGWMHKDDVQAITVAS